MNAYEHYSECQRTSTPPINASGDTTNADTYSAMWGTPFVYTMPVNASTDTVWGNEKKKRCVFVFFSCWGMNFWPSVREVPTPCCPPSEPLLSPLLSLPWCDPMWLRINMDTCGYVTLQIRHKYCMGDSVSWCCRLSVVTSIGYQVLLMDCMYHSVFDVIPENDKDICKNVWIMGGGVGGSLCLTLLKGTLQILTLTDLTNPQHWPRVHMLSLSL